MKSIFTLFAVFSIAVFISLISCESNNEKYEEQLDNEIDKALQDSIPSIGSSMEEPDSIEINTSDANKEPEKEISIDEKISEVMQNTAEDSPPLKNNGDPKKGKELFLNTCASCHGMKGLGDGVAAVSLDPKPRNLTDNKYVSELSDNHLFRVISLGGVSVGKSALMPPWGGILSEEEIWNIISHIRKNLCNCSHKNE
ncbi:MAG: c-type cytochrome [Candidatus Dadabacteria bacterium]|nr:c-type cytochrome [Candidatus Dadabacteria bacterium]NIQ16675.1 c-type cytochrome [Candidatus Dadabacteria bacterium]